MSRTLAALLTLCLVPAASAAGFGEPQGGWPDDSPTGTGKVDLSEALGADDARYRFAVPEGYSSEEAWPVAIVLHGGPGGKAQAMASVYARSLMERGVIGVFPQALEKQLLDWNYPHSTAYLVAVLKDLNRRYRIDPTRLYLMGHSMGGGGVWAQGAVLSDLWAGLGPLSGWAIPTPAPDFDALVGIPMYCIHGAADKAVPAKISDMGFDRLEQRKARVFRFEELPELEERGEATHCYHRIPEVGHNVFTPMKKRGPALAAQLDWLLEHRRERPADLTAAGRKAVAWGEPFGWRPVEGSPLGTYEGE